MNYPLQAVASDISKLTLGYVREELEGLEAQLINSIHDEFVVECAEGVALAVSERAKRARIRAGEDILEKVPVDVEVAIYREWQQ